MPILPQSVVRRVTRKIRFMVPVKVENYFSVGYAGVIEKVLTMTYKMEKFRSCQNFSIASCTMLTKLVVKQLFEYTLYTANGGEKPG